MNYRALSMPNLAVVGNCWTDFSDRGPEINRPVSGKNAAFHGSLAAGNYWSDFDACGPTNPKNRLAHAGKCGPFRFLGPRPPSPFALQAAFWSTNSSMFLIFEATKGSTSGAKIVSSRLSRRRARSMSLNEGWLLVGYQGRTWSGLR